MKSPTLSSELLHKMDAYWRAANYLSVGQIYLFDNPLLKRPLALADVKHMLLGHWGTLNPVTDGVVLPILHLNGYKIANPTILARIDHEELEQLLRGYGWTPYFVEGDDPELMHEAMPATLDTAVEQIKHIQHEARVNSNMTRPRWPMIVLKSPKGWTGPKVVDGQQIEGTFRSHQVPLSDPATHPEHLQLLEDWLRSYRPEELFDETGRLIPELAELAPQGNRRMGANHHANGGILLRNLQKPGFSRLCRSRAGARFARHRRHSRAWPIPARHCAAGIGVWDWASNDQGTAPDVVMACCGDVPTLETLAAVSIMREHLPELKIRVVNVVDLMRLQPPSEHPHGLSDVDFDNLFTKDKPVIFAYHAYPWLIHRLTYRRTNHDNIHVRGYKEEGPITTPFDMTVLNDLDRFHLVMDTIDRLPQTGEAGVRLKKQLTAKLIEHRQYINQNGQDMPEIRNWKWESPHE